MTSWLGRSRHCCSRARLTPASHLPLFLLAGPPSSSLVQWLPHLPKWPPGSSSSQTAYGHIHCHRNLAILLENILEVLLSSMLCPNSFTWLSELHSKGNHRPLASSPLYPQDEPWEFGELEFLVIPPKSVGLSYDMAFICLFAWMPLLPANPLAPPRISFLPICQRQLKGLSQGPQLKPSLLPRG